MEIEIEQILETQKVAMLRSWRVTYHSLSFLAINFSSSKNNCHKTIKFFMVKTISHSKTIYFNFSKFSVMSIEKKNENFKLN